jgi:signal transduction histidine kinase
MGGSRPRIWAGRAPHGLALLLALSAATLAAVALDVRPGAAVALLLTAVALVLAGLGYLLHTLAQRRLVDQMSRRAELADHERATEFADRERAAEALASRAAEMERGNAQLSETNARLSAALTFKNDLTSMLTHDVAQPISSIASLAELLCADWTDLPDDIRFELATKIDKNTHRLITMMNDLQLLFRLDTGSVTARRAPVPLLEVVLAVTTTEDDLDVEVDEDLAVLADREHLTVVMQNLVTNAFAYGEMPVLVQAARHGATIAVTVQDNGPGVPEEQLPNLFGRCTRGAGLGLFVVRHLVEANGASVRYEQVRPRGARFTVTWEAAPV